MVEKQNKLDAPDSSVLLQPAPTSPVPLQSLPAELWANRTRMANFPRSPTKLQQPANPTLSVPEPLTPFAQQRSQPQRRIRTGRHCDYSKEKVTEKNLIKKKEQFSNSASPFHSLQKWRHSEGFTHHRVHPGGASNAPLRAAPLAPVSPRRSQPTEGIRAESSRPECPQVFRRDVGVFTLCKLYISNLNHLQRASGYKAYLPLECRS